jgi:hypothetical protein
VTFGAELDIATFRDEYHSYLQVEVIKGSVQGYKLKKYPSYNKRDLMVEGSGFLQWLSVFALATDPEIDVLLLDEPDAHLHPSLQEQLIDGLRQLSADRRKQVLIATHSAEILRHAEPTDIFQVRKGGGGYLKEEKQKVGLLAGLGTDYAPRVDKAKRTKRILFVEGRSDLAVLKVLAEILETHWPESWTEWTTPQGHKERRQLYLALKSEIPELTVLSLRDRDDEPAETVGIDLVDNPVAHDPDFHPRRWRRRYIESYLIWPPAIAAASGVVEDEIREYLGEQHGIAVPANFADSDVPQALLDARGKEILKSVDGTPVLTQLNVSALDVARQMNAESIPEDIKTFLGDLGSLG